MRVGRHCQIESVMKDLSLPPHLVLGNYGQRQDTPQPLCGSQAALLLKVCAHTHTLADPHCVWESGVTHSMQSDKVQKSERQL